MAINEQNYAIICKSIWNGGGKSAEINEEREDEDVSPDNPLKFKS